MVTLKLRNGIAANYAKDMSYGQLSNVRNHEGYAMKADGSNQKLIYLHRGWPYEWR